VLRRPYQRPRYAHSHFLSLLGLKISRYCYCPVGPDRRDGSRLSLSCPSLALQGGGVLAIVTLAWMSFRHTLT
jgi:hypothetical protein